MHVCVYVCVCMCIYLSVCAGVCGYVCDFACVWRQQWTYNALRTISLWSDPVLWQRTTLNGTPIEKSQNLFLFFFPLKQERSAVSLVLSPHAATEWWRTSIYRPLRFRLCGLKWLHYVSPVFRFLRRARRLCLEPPPHPHPVSPLLTTWMLWC